MQNIKQLLLISIIICFIHLPGTQLTAQNSKTSIGIAISPGFSTLYSKLSKDFWDSRFAISGGLNIRHDIANGKIFLQSGLNYTCRGFANENQITDNQGNIVGTIKGEESFHYVELPLSAAYNLNGFFIGGGISFNYLVKRKFIVDGKLISTEIQHLEKFKFGTHLFAGHDLKLSQQFSLSLNAYVNYLFQYSLLNYGAEVGLRYTICRSTDKKERESFILPGPYL